MTILKSALDAMDKSKEVMMETGVTGFFYLVTLPQDGNDTRQTVLCVYDTDKWFDLVGYLEVMLTELKLKMVRSIQDVSQEEFLGPRGRAN